MQKKFILIIILVVGLGVYEIGTFIKNQNVIFNSQIDNYIPDSKTQNENCILANSLPDHRCTPGDVFKDATAKMVCVTGYSKTVRNVSEALKKEVYKQYGIKTYTPGDYQIDHFISLALGGSNNIANLWPQPAKPEPGYKQKDKVENYLRELLCQGKITLGQAQKLVSVEWPMVYLILQPKDPLVLLLDFIKQQF